MIKHFDIEHERSFWQPRSHPNNDNSCDVVIARGEGIYVYDSMGKKYIDAVSSLFNVNVGHGRKEIKDAIAVQLDQLEYHPIFLGFSHPKAESLSQKIIELLKPEGMKKIIFGSGGSDAVETALMLSRQYWKINRQPERTKFISLKQSYHGCHYGGASVTGIATYRRNYEPLMPGCYHIEAPLFYRNTLTDDPNELGRISAGLLEKEILFHGADTIAAFIAEPILTTGGVIVPPENYWPLIREICNKYDVLLIADEVVTGFGRSGEMFGCRNWGVAPDIMCFAKGISSGYLPLGATAFNSKIANAFGSNPDTLGTIMHGFTYSGHPVACAAGLANLQIVLDEQLTENAKAQGDYMLSQLKQHLSTNEHVGEIRGKGLMLAIELITDKITQHPVDISKGYHKALVKSIREAGVLLRALGSRLLLAPPLASNRKEIDAIIDTVVNGLTCTKY